MKNQYIIFDGTDGSGKTTLADQLSKRLGEHGHRTLRLDFPSRASCIGKLIRDTFVGKAEVDLHAMLWLFIAEAKDQEACITEYLNDGWWVICDRHPQFSTRIYQTPTNGAACVEAAMAAANFRAADSAYIIDVPPATALARRATRGGPRNLLGFEPETIAKIEVQRQAFRVLVDRFLNASLVDGDRPTEAILADIEHDLGLS